MGRSRAIAMLVVMLATIGVARADRPAPKGGATKTVVVLVGYPGSGKGELGKVLGRRARARGWVSSDVIREEVRRRGLEEIPANLSAVGKDMQEKEPGVVGRRLAAKIVQSRARRHYVDGLRTVADVNALREIFPDAKLAKVDVPGALRYPRMLLRGRLGETTVEVLQARDAADEKLGVGDLMRMESGPGESFLLQPGEGLDSLSRAATPVVRHLNGR